ncbi:MAG TPA: glycosyltransferase family 2 protein [Usitatibacter sp.]|jgi:GT2 family glycosyltransferase|nr:glycosyltransferase family 2 protein [Usitatibacter sp.]
MAEVDITVVTYQPDLALLSQLVASLAEPAPGVRRNLLIQDNSADPAVAASIAALPAVKDPAFARVDIERSGANLGFGRGQNAAAARGTAPWIFVLNQDCILEPGVLAPLLEGAGKDPERIAIWELRQIPYEHPKAYDPVTLDTAWASGAAMLVRRTAFEEVRGFDPRIFMYGEDVDFSWRLRAKGWRVAYRPRFAVVHRTYAEAGEVKPLQVLGGVLTNLELRARYGGLLAVLRGLAMLWGELLAPRSFRGRRRGLARAGLLFMWRWPYFAWTGVHATAQFKPLFNGWGYEMRRDGAFVEFASVREAPDRPRPLVSIIIRTVDRAAWLREALQSCAQQTYPNLEVVVIEDGPERSRAIAESFAGRLDVRYLATGNSVGRARAGNLALAQARGEWLNFLDDDDLFFADHVEVLVDAVQRGNVAGAYALAWETQTEFLDREHARYEEVLHLTRHYQRFDRITLWHHNYLPIQAVMFHRRLYERYGGFDEGMDQLEDWNLWTRYTLEDDLVMVEKTTSKYRVPANARVAADRQALLDRAYRDALERQRELRITLSPREISEMADAYVRGQAVMMVTRNDLRRFVGANRMLSRLATYRAPAARVLRRFRVIR